MKIAVFGAGSIGAYVGGALLATGAEVVLIGRAGMQERIARDGLQLSDLRGRSSSLPPADIPYSTDAADLAGASLILVTVKSADTAAAAQAIRSHAPRTALVISLQNGIGNGKLLREQLSQSVLPGMVPFNVVQMPGGRLHRGTEGELMVEASPVLSPWLEIFAKAGLPLQERADFDAVQWGKLLLNLNNPVNALSGLPLKAELSQHAYRRCLAMLMEEALAVMQAAGIKPAKLARLKPHMLPLMLRLPDILFHRLAAAMLDIDEKARSSMWEDLQAGRRTEVDYINGAVVALAESIGRDAPVNRRIVELIREAEQGKKTAFEGKALYQALLGR